MVVGADMQGCEVAVIGSGPGGYLAAIRLGQLKKDVILIEKHKSLGGVCLNVGCIPSKALVHAADFYTATKHAKRMGINIPEASVDMPKLIDWKDKVVKKLTSGVKYLCENNGVEIVRGKAKFTGNRQLEVLTDKGNKIIEFQKAVIAVGSKLRAMDGFEPDEDKIFNTYQALSMKEIPERLTIIGGGYTGLEFAHIFTKLGSKVNIVDFKPQLLPYIDEDVRKLLMRSLKRLKVDLYLEHHALTVDKGTPMKLTIKNNDGEEQTLETDKIIMAIGNMPNTEELGLDMTDVTFDDDGFIKTNERLETEADGIYAVGDVIGRPRLAHKAYREAKVAAEAIAGNPAAFDNYVIPAAIFTDPEIAWAGLSHDEALEQGYQVVVGSFPFRASGRAMTLNEAEGFVKTIADAESKRILGIHIVGPDASELISEAAVSIEMGAFLDDLSQTIHVHPTLSEGLMESVSAALGEAIHVLNPKSSSKE